MQGFRSCSDGISKNTPPPPQHRSPATGRMPKARGVRVCCEGVLQSDPPTKCPASKLHAKQRKKRRGDEGKMCGVVWWVGVTNERPLFGHAHAPKAYFGWRHDTFGMQTDA